MATCLYLLLICFLASADGAADIPQQTPLSAEPHTDESGAHSDAYDHEAFLGTERAKRFENLSEEEAKQELGLLFGQIDTSGDGLVSEQELLAWIRHVQHELQQPEVNRKWAQHKLEPHQTLDFHTYDNVFASPPPVDLDPRSLAQFAEHVQQLRRQWEAADLDEDGRLSRDEYICFTHPADYRHMQITAVHGIIAELDQDGDEKLTEEEYLDYTAPSGENAQEEKERFASFDKNEDGELDEMEVQAWIAPGLVYDEEEAKHLVLIADADKDGQLNKNEVLQQWSVFVGSRTTYNGKLKPLPHEEL